MTHTPIPTLYIVSTPIGTLADLSLRAQKILSEVEFILCEDTRHTLKLLSHFGISNRLESLHLHNEKERAQQILEKLVHSEKKTAALVSDAGTPCISDPGSFFIAAAHENQIKILTVPGPSSLTSGLAACGFIQPRTVFSGFLDKNTQSLKQEVERWKSISPCISVFFESPKRVLKTLATLKEVLPENTQICVSREISKKFEEHIRGSIEFALNKLQESTNVQGELVVCVQIEKSSHLESVISPDELAQKALLISLEEKKLLKQCCKDVVLNTPFTSKEIYLIALKKKNNAASSH